MVPCKRTAEEVSFEWSHHKIRTLQTRTLLAPTLYMSQLLTLAVEEFIILQVAQNYQKAISLRFSCFLFRVKTINTKYFTKRL